MASLLCGNSDVYDNRVLLPFPVDVLHKLLPVPMKCRPESYVAIEDGKLNGMIALKPNKGNYRKWKIIKLILNENSFLTGRQLIEYAITQYGANGVNTFIVNIESSQQEVLELFSKGCGFKFCSFEQLWKMNKIVLSEPALANTLIRPFKNSDAEAVCELYNEGIYSQFRNSLCKSKKEFYNTLFVGVEKISTYKYVLENKTNKNITGYILIKTEDNYNYMLELTLSSMYDDNFNELIGYAMNQISRRTKKFNLFVINKKYKQNSIAFEKYLEESGYELKQSQSVLVKDYFKRIEQNEQQFGPAIIFTNIKGKPAYN